MTLPGHTPPLFSLPDASLPFLRTGIREYSYGQLYCFASHLSEALHTRGWQSGSGRPLLLYTRPDAATLFMMAAAFLLKLPVLPLPQKTNEKELQHILSKVAPLLYFCSGDEVTGRIEGCSCLIPDLSSWISDSVPPDHRFSLAGADQTAGLFLTSGSTGFSKLVPLKRSQIFFAAHASSVHVKAEPASHWLLTLPLNHVGGASIIYRSLLYHSAIWLQEGFDSDAVRILLSEQPEISVASMVPTMLHQIMKDPVFQPHSGFRALLLGGGPITEKLVLQALSRKIPVVTSYGMTETAAQIASNPLTLSETPYTGGDAGPIFPPNEAEIRDDAGLPLPHGSSGKIWLRGPQLFGGYHAYDEAQPFDLQGWFDTGDFGRITEKGHLIIQSRRTDLIITGGENASAAVTEEALERFEGVARAAVIGVPDETWGQKMVAFIEPEKEMEPDQASILAQLKGELLPHQIPKEIILTDRLPVTPALKIKKAELRERYAQTHS
ncbi:MAG: hypothetical protein EA360_00660 [Balneolaceae bacterium]|nr:MAG: hypothetical protein EA360_00660 [Balneolaceae bacterium]